MASSSRMPYSRRLFVWLVAYSLVLMGCVVFFQYRREKQFKAGELNERLQQINAEILDDMEAGVDFRAFRRAAAPEGMRVSVIDPEGRVVYDNTLDTLPAGNHLHREEIAAAMRDGSGYCLRRHSESTGGTYFYSARRGADGMVVRTAVPYSVSLHTLLKADYGFLWVIGSVTLLMCTLGYFATRRMGMHIRRLREFAEKAEKGERIYDSGSFPHDELGDISHNIVRLYASLQRATSERDREHAAALRDRREKEQIKKRLTENINHELKTPVAAIQACLETMVDHPDMDAVKRMEFTRRALANTGRLRQLLDDVALITRMEEGRHNITLGPVDLAGVIRETAAEHEADARARGIGIRLSLPPALPMTGNRQLLESVFNNLLDNALSYSGATEVSVTGGTTPSGGIRVTVADNGSGVGEEHLPRLFERSYRVDKGRSRAAGGTGLGLSIVRNAVALHGGTITVANRGGLEFDIDLPSNAK